MTTTPSTFRNRYHIQDQLGSGGAGTVFKVREVGGGRGEGRALALKALFTDASKDELLVETMRREFRVLATLRHPQLARVYDFGRIPAGNSLPGSRGRPGLFFTRDMVDGDDLAAYCLNQQPVRILRVLQRTAEALDLLHRAGMVHGDFKPANVIVDQRGQPHLIDFGLVRGEGRDSSTSGTAAYLAPESLRGEIVDRRADLYALGITLYQLLAGRLPLPGASLHKVLNWHLAGDALALEDDPFLPDTLRHRINKVLRRLARRERGKRYPTAGEAALALAELVKAAGGKPASPEPGLFVPPAPGENLTELVTELEQVAGRRLLDGEEGPPLVLLAGEPGSGKSTLLTELAWRCQLGGVEVVRGEPVAGDPRVLGAWHDLLALVTGFSGAPHPLGEQQASEHDPFSVYQQICDYLVASAAGAPILVLLDSAHEAGDEDRAAFRFLRHTLPASAPVMFVLASAEDEALARDLGQPTTRRLVPLAAGDLVRMVRDASGREDPELGRRIHDHTGGNPRYSLRVLRRLSEHGWPTAPDLRSLAPPGDLEQMHHARWDDLAPAEQQTLRALAVLGRPAAGALLLELVLEAAEEAELDLVGLPLERLEQEAWVQRNQDGMYQFSQGPVSGLVYGWCEGDSRLALHRAAAAALRRSGDEDPVERARHAVGAGEADEALDALTGARERLARLGAHRRAIQIHEDTLALLPGEDPRRAEILAQLGRIQRAAGDLDPALASLEKARAGLQGAAALQAGLALAAVHREAGRGEQAVEVLNEILAGELTEHHEVRALAELAAAQVALDEHEAVLETVARALEIMDQAAPDTEAPVDAPSEARLRGNRAWSLGYLQRYDASDRAFHRALDAARDSESPREEASILNMMAVLAFRRAEYGRMGELSLEALERAEAARDMERVATVRLNLGVFYMQRGEYAQCLEHLEQSLRLFEAMGARRHLAPARCNHGYVLLKLGLLEQAHKTLRQAVDETREVGSRAGEALALVLLALVAARQGHAGRARQGIDAARRIYLEVGQQRDAGDALLDLTQVELDAGKAEAARQALDQACQELELEQYPDLAARELCLRARLAVWSEDEGAMEGLERALTIAKDLDSAELLWECHAAGEDLSRTLGRDAEAGEHARAGAEIQRRMARGLSPEARAAFWQDPRRQRLRELVAEQDTARPAPAQGLSRSLKSDGRIGLLETMRAPGGRGQDTPVTQLEQDLVKERFYRLLEIYRRINSELDRERLLGLVMDTAVELTGAERGFLLLGDTPDTIKVEVARNLVLEGEEGEYSRSIAERVYRSGRPVITVSAHNDPRFKEYLSVHQLQLESVLCIPIHARDRVAGVLYMESRFQSGRFTPDDQRLLMAFGDQVAIALTNARLLQDNIKKAEDLEKANARIEALAEERLRLLDRRTEQLEQARHDLAETRRKLESTSGKFGMVGLSEPMLQLFHLVDRVARTDVPVLVEGESGTGKEMVARAIHDNSARKGSRLVSVNCAAIPEGLLESELFGHVRGAFTGADRDRKGLFQAAHGGTLFLDEIGDMPHRMQVDLLRALQEKTIRPVGAQEDRKVDVRVIAASNKPLADLVQQGKFREDLFYRLNVVSLKLPPLRNRMDDIPLLVDHFLGRISDQVKGPRRKVGREAMRRLMAYAWPGNVRQLEHTLMNAAVLADGELLQVDDFNLEAPATAADRAEPKPAGRQERKEQEKARILQALEACGWNKSKAARMLGIPRRTFYRRLSSFGIS